MKLQYATPEHRRLYKRDYERAKRQRLIDAGVIVGKRACPVCAGLGHTKRTCPEVPDEDEPKPATLTKAWHLLAAVYRGRCRAMEDELRWWRETYGEKAKER